MTPAAPHCLTTPEPPPVSAFPPSSFAPPSFAPPSFAPFSLKAATGGARLTFSDWAWLEHRYGPACPHPRDGRSLEDLVRAALQAARIPLDESVAFASEADTCCIYFKTPDTALRAAGLAATMIRNPATLAAMAELAQAKAGGAA